MDPSENGIVLGTDADTGEDIVLPDPARRTHLYVAGKTGVGKSKFLERMIREDIKAWHKKKEGMLLIDPHGSLYDSVMKWAAWNNLKVPIVPIDLRQSDWVVAYNVLRKRKDADPSAIVSHFVEAMAHVWHAGDLSKTPLFARWASNIIGTLYHLDHTILEAEFLIDARRREMRQAFTEKLPDGLASRDWASADMMKVSEFENQVSSTVNRLHPFLETKALKRMFGQSDVSLDLSKSIEEGQIILVSLATEGNLISQSDAHLFATLLLTDLWQAARQRGKGDKTRNFRVYLDEMHLFITPTIAANLDQARGFGISLILAQQYPQQTINIGEQVGKQLYDSITVNARNKVIFSMAGEENLKLLAQELFSGVMSPDKIKHELYSTKVMEYVEEMRTSYSAGSTTGTSHGSQKGRASGRGRGGTKNFQVIDGVKQLHPNALSDSDSSFASGSESEGESVTESHSYSESSQTILVPKFGKELSSVQFESLDEQLYRAMAQLYSLEDRHAVVRLSGWKAPKIMKIPDVDAMPGRDARVLAYREERLKALPFALRSADADRNLADRRAKLIGTQEAVEEIPRKRRLKE